VKEESKSGESIEIALDCSWADAIAMVLVAVFCSMFAVVLAWTTINGYWKPHPPSIENILFLIGVGVLVFYSTRDRRVRFAFGIFIFCDVWRAAAWLLHASSGVQRTTVLVDRWVTVAFFTAVAGYIVVWFKKTIRHV
jgi:hypothetical protein